MARQREIMVGSRDRFAVKIAFLTDPDQGRAATREHSISWGAIEVWANGHNLCRHVELGESIDAVHWYLLPILQWLASNWDFLLHEERLPGGTPHATPGFRCSGQQSRRRLSRTMLPSNGR